MASFLSQLGGLVSPGLTVATQAVGAQKEGEIAGHQIANKTFLDTLKAQRELSAAKDESALKQAQTFALQQPKNASRGEAVWNPAKQAYEIPSPYEEEAPKTVSPGAGVRQPDGSYKVMVPPNPDMMTRFFEGQRLENDQRQAAEWQRHYDRLVTPKMTKYGTVEEGTGLSPAEAAAQADAIYGSHPRLAPNIAAAPTTQPPMGTSYTPRTP